MIYCIKINKYKVILIVIIIQLSKFWEQSMIMILKSLASFWFNSLINYMSMREVATMIEPLNH